MSALHFHKRGKERECDREVPEPIFESLLPNREREPEACSGYLGHPAGIPDLPQETRKTTRRGKRRAEDMRGMLLSLAVNIQDSNIRRVASVLSSISGLDLPPTLHPSRNRAPSHHLSSHLISFTVTRTTSTLQLPNYQLVVATSSSSLTVHVPYLLHTDKLPTSYSTVGYLLCA